MIIEIRDLPKDRKIKNISFDISFENNHEEKIVLSEKVPENNTNIPIIREPIFENNIEQRETKEIPAEMLDQSF